MGVFHNGVVPCKCHAPIFFLVLKCVFTVRGGAEFHGTFFAFHSLPHRSQEPPAVSCVVLDPGSWIWWFCIPLCRQPSSLPDASGLLLPAADPRAADFHSLTFSFLRFCGLFFHPEASAGDLFLQGIYAGVCVLRRIRSLCRRRMACSVFVPFYGSLGCCVTVSLLQPAYFRGKSLFSRGIRHLRMHFTGRCFGGSSLYSAASAAVFIMKERVGSSDSCWI